MMEQVKILIDLQEVMCQARRLDEEKQKIPLEVADLKSLFEEREASFLATEQEFETLKLQRREKEREIEEERDKVERAKAKTRGAERCRPEAERGIELRRSVMGEAGEVLHIEMQVLVDRKSVV